MDLHTYTALGAMLAEEWLQFGAIIIAIGVARALVTWLAQHLPGSRRAVETESIRLGLGRSLGLALEFLLAADILSTAIAPTWDAIGKLAAIATIRAILNYFLGQAHPASASLTHTCIEQRDAAASRLARSSSGKELRVLADVFGSGARFPS